MTEEERFRNEGIIDGLSPAMLTNLKDISVKFGSIDVAAQLTTFDPKDYGLEIPLIVISSFDPNQENILTIIKSPKPNPICISTSSGWVWWDADLSAEDVNNSIRDIDAFAQKTGHFVAETGERKAMPLRFNPTKKLD